MAYEEEDGLRESMEFGGIAPRHLGDLEVSESKHRNRQAAGGYQQQDYGYGGSQTKKGRGRKKGHKKGRQQQSGYGSSSY